MNTKDNITKLKDSTVEDTMDTTSTINPVDTKKLSKPFRETYFSKTKNNESGTYESITASGSNTLKNSSQPFSNSYSKYVPYSISELEKQVKYFNSCAYYEYASALSRYLELLRIYKTGKMPHPPKYPDLCKYQSEPKDYKRPAMYQGVGRTGSVRTNELACVTSKSSLKYEEPLIEKEITLMHEIPEEIGIMIK